MDFTGGEPSTQVARLCERCQVLSFDDSDPRFNITGEVDVRPYLVVDLDYLLHDSLPNLPILHESAKAGCDFCRLLRDSILSEDSAADDALRRFLMEMQGCDVELTLQYGRMPPQNCHSKGLPAPRMMVLTALLNAEYNIEEENEENDRSCTYISFLVEGCEGSRALDVFTLPRPVLTLTSSLNRSRPSRAMASAA